MACDVVVRKFTNGPWVKGMPTSVRQLPYPWKPGAPDRDHFVRIRITDADADQIRDKIEQWKNPFDHEILNENDSGWRVRVSVNAATIFRFGSSRGAAKQEVRDLLVNQYGAIVHDYDATEWGAWVIFDIPKNQGFTLKDIKDHCTDIFEEVLAPGRWRFPDTDVDLAALQPDQIYETTLAVARSRIIDRLTD